MHLLFRNIKWDFNGAKVEEVYDLPKVILIKNATSESRAKNVLIPMLLNWDIKNCDVELIEKVDDCTLKDFNVDLAYDEDTGEEYQPFCED